MDTPDRLQFYSRSADKRPGAGAGEYAVDMAKYRELSQVSHWRQKLSNFSDSCVITYGGVSFRTIEHAFHFAKCSLADAQTAQDFAIESGSALSKGSGLDARRARKLVNLGENDLRLWSAQRPDFLKEMWRQKAENDPEFRRILLLTHDAELWHYPGLAIPVERWRDLEDIRADLLDSEQTDIGSY